MSIGIIDYGMANLRSVQKGFETVGVNARIISRPEEIEGMEKIVLPGVVAMLAALRVQRDTGLVDPQVHGRRGHHNDIADAPEIGRAHV